jgi:hypothetical protein
MDRYEIIISSKPLDLPFQKAITDRCVQSVSPNTELLTNETATLFHAHSIPEVTIPQYLDRCSFLIKNNILYRLFRHLLCSRECYIYALLFLGRYLQFTKSVLTLRNVHRLLITSFAINFNV